MSQPSPLLSVTVLNYNYGHYLGQCLTSLLGQSMTDFEIILINDCSTDDSRTVIEPFLADPRIRFVDHPENRGYVASLLEGCTLSQGRYLTVVSADDYALASTAFEQVCRLMEADPTVSFCYGAWQEVDDRGRVRHERRGDTQDYVRDGAAELRRLLLSSPVLHSGTVIRRSAYEVVGGYDKTCRYSVDTNMWLALCAAGKVAHVSQFLFAYRAHDGNMSQSGGSLWRATEEMLYGIDTALARFTDADLPDREILRHRARQCALVAVPTVDIFAGRFRRGWNGYLQAVRRYPRLTLCQSRTVSLLLRIVLGARGYAALTSRRRQMASRRAFLERAETYA